MAKTFPVRTLRVRQPGDPHMSYAVRHLPEGASQTFIASAPVVATSGLIVEAADPVAAVYGIAVRAGQNTTGATAEIIPVVDNLEFFANFLVTATGADNVLAAADLGVSGFQVEKNTVGGNVIWHVADKADGTDAAQMVSFDSDIQVANQVQSKAAAGDTNARCSFVFINSVRTYDGA